MTLSALVLTVAVATAGAPLGFVTEASVPGDVVTLGDIGILEDLPAEIRERARTVPLARIGGGIDHVVFDARWVADRARAQLPILAPWTVGVVAGDIIVRQQSTPPKPSPRNCLRSAVRIKAGVAPIASEFASATCSQGSMEAFRFDPSSGLPVVAVDLEEGAIVGSPGAMPTVRRGQALRLVANVGVVSVERQVEAVQDASAGGEVFVRGADGRVFSAPAPEAIQ